MFQCCTNLRQSQKITDRIQPCKIHGKPILFVCLNYDTCRQKALFCTDCSDRHKGHSWETVTNFFNEQVKQILTNKSNQQEQRIEEVLNQTLDEFQKSKAKIQYKLIQIENALKLYFQELKEKYPPLVGAQFNQDEVIDNEKMPKIFQILRNREINDWVQEFEQDLKQIIQPAQEFTLSYYNDLQILIKNKEWDVEPERKKNFKSYIQKHFPPSQKDDPYFFRFSQVDKNSYIDVNKDDLEAIYKDDTYQNIQKPAILTTRKLTPHHNRVYFKINQISKTALIFDASKIGIGVCIPNNARGYNFLNLHKHSHGAYMMLSNGRVFHSKLPQFINSKGGFSFGKGDIVQMWIDFSEKVIHFERKGFLQHRFQMDLALNDKYMAKLRPFIQFQGELGAAVEILSGREVKEGKLIKQKSKQSKLKSTKVTSASSNAAR